jgi:hypothetical protein
LYYHVLSIFFLNLYSKILINFKPILQPNYNYQLNETIEFNNDNYYQHEYYYEKLLMHNSNIWGDYKRIAYV